MQAKYFYFSYKLFLINALCLLAFNAFAQKTNFPEKIYVHFDKPLYVLGEDIWYKSYFLNEDTSQIQSHVLHIEILDPDGKSVLHQQLPITKNYAIGDINIPLTWKEGYYTFAAYTYWNMNFDKKYQYITTLAIYNDLIQKELPPHSESEEKIQLPILENINDKNKTKITVDANKPAYHKNDTVILNIIIQDEKRNPIATNLSISVIELSSLPIALFDKNLIFDRKNDLLALPKNIKVPTTQAQKQIVVQGTINAPNEDSNEKSNFYALYLSENKQILRTKSDNKAVFKIGLPDFYGTQAIQAINLKPNTLSPKIEIERISNRNILLNNEQKQNNLERTPQIEQYLAQIHLQRKINTLFNVQNNHKLNQKNNQKNVPIPDIVYPFKNYQEIKTVEDFVLDGLSKSWLERQNGKKTIRMYNFQTETQFRYAPRYIIDGLWVDDESALLELPASSIDRVEVFSKSKSIEQYFDAGMKSGGIFSVFTKSGNNPLAAKNAHNYAILEGFYKERKFSSTYASDKQMPILQPLVYWNPSVNTNTQGSANISFSHSSAIGFFLIQIKGISDKGDLIEFAKIYEVK